MTAKKLIFTCPKCGGHSIEEVVNCNQASFLITHIDTDGEVEYADPVLDEDAMLEHYCCADCGHVLKNIFDIEDLKEYLEKNNK